MFVKFGESDENGNPLPVTPIVNVTHVNPYTPVNTSGVSVPFPLLVLLVALATFGIGELVAVIAIFVI